MIYLRISQIIYTEFQSGCNMATTQKLKNSLNAIENARKSLNRAKRVDEAKSKVKVALRELDDAESHIRKAIRELD